MASGQSHRRPRLQHRDRDGARLRDPPSQPHHGGRAAHAHRSHGNAAPAPPAPPRSPPLTHGAHRPAQRRAGPRAQRTGGTRTSARPRTALRGRGQRCGARPQGLLATTARRQPQPHWLPFAPPLTRTPPIGPAPRGLLGVVVHRSGRRGAPGTPCAGGTSSGGGAHRGAGEGPGRDSGRRSGGSVHLWGRPRALPVLGGPVAAAVPTRSLKCAMLRPRCQQGREGGRCGDNAPGAAPL